MAFISSSIPNMVNGVSQQPQVLRLPSQADEQVNGFSSTSSGLRKRAETNFVASLFPVAITDPRQVKIHWINRDGNEKYVVVFQANNLRVFDLNGVEQTVNFPDGKAYITEDFPQDSIRALTIADFTFIVNSNREVRESVELSPKRPYEAIVSVKGGNYGKKYEVKIDGNVLASFTTPDGTAGSHAAQIGTDFIAQQLYNDLVATQNIASLGPFPTRVYFREPGTDRAAGNSNSSNSYYVSAIQVPVGVRSETIAATVGNYRYTVADNPFIAAFRFFNGDVLKTFFSRPYVEGSPFVSQNGGFDPFNPPPNFKTVWVAHPGLPTPPTLSLVGVNSTNDGSGNVTTQARELKLFGSTIYISQDNDFTIEATDDFNNNAMQAYKGEIQNFEELPANGGAEGFTIKVVGDSVTEDDDFHLTWVPFKSSVNTGVWRETVEPNTVIGLDESTMPHILVREADGTFTFKRAEYGQRVTGNKESNPAPSFVGKKIANLFFFKNRLGYVANEQVVMSEASEYFNFYRSTVRQLLDSDPIDIAVAHSRVSDIKWAVPLSRRLLLLSSQTQFAIDGNELLTPKTANAKVLTEFDCSIRCQPKILGRNLYFPYEASGFTKVREFYIDADEVADAADVTAHVDRYIPPNVHAIAEASNEDFMALLTNDRPNEMYVYKFYLQGTEKLQSSWSVWEFKPQEKLLGANFYSSELYIVTQRDNRMVLEKMDLREESVSPSEPYRVLLDSKFTTSAGVFQSPITLFTAPYPVNGLQEYFGVVAAGQPDAGLIVNLQVTGTNLLFAEGDYSGVTMVIGCRYKFRYKFSTIFAPKPSNGARQADQLVKLMLRNMVVNFNETGWFKALVTPEARDTYEYVFSGKTLGVSSNIIGQVNLVDGSFKFPIGTKNLNTDIVLENDTPLPSVFTSADWEATFVKRTRGV